MRMCILCMGEPGRMVGRFTLHDDRTLFLFVLANESNAPASNARICKRQCCATDMVMENGNVRGSWTSSIARMSFISTASA